jgi:hypothetical protein
VTCPSLRTTSGARQSPPKGRLRNGLFEESACRRGMRRDIEAPRRPLPLKAHVRRSAVSVGFAAGRLTGTRGTWTADVDHSRPSSALRVLCALREKPDPSTRAVVDLSRSDLPEPSKHPRDIEGSSRSLPSKAHVRCSAVSVGFAVGRLTGTRGTWTADADHSPPSSALRVLCASREKPEPIHPSRHRSQQE